MSYDTPWKVVPIRQWPGDLTRSRKRSPFRTSWTATVRLLERELRNLSAKNTVLQMPITDDEIRLDGRVRANARPTHPGVILTFDSRHGPLSYPCDRFGGWQDNVRAIALALEALRKVDRYGVTKRGEQYTGWKALPPAGGTTENRPEVIQRGRDLISEHGSVRNALFAAHPDRGGDPDDFHAVQVARGQ